MGLFGEIIDQSINFAKEIATDSASFVKGVAQTCEPYAREVIDQVTRALGDADEVDEANRGVEVANSRGGTPEPDVSEQPSPKTAVEKETGAHNAKRPMSFEKAPQQEVSQIKTSETDVAEQADREAVAEAFDEGKMSDESCAEPNVGQSEREDLAQKTPNYSPESSRVMLNVDIQAIFEIDPEAPFNVSAAVDIQTLTAELQNEANLESEPEPKSEKSPPQKLTQTQEQRKPLRHYRNVSDWTQVVDGIQTSESKRHAHWFGESRQVVLEKDRLDAVILHVEFCQAIEEPAVIEGFYTPSATKKQKQAYWTMRGKCDEAGIEYNKRDIPHTRREYTAAITALQRLLDESEAE